MTMTAVCAVFGGDILPDVEGGIPVLIAAWDTAVATEYRSRGLR